MDKKFSNFSSGRTVTSWLKTSYATFIGDQRERMEDRISVFKFRLNQSKFYGFLVLDGHGGSEVADFVLANFSRYLKIDLSKHGDIKIATDKTFCRLNDAVLAYKSGTTISLLLIHENVTGKREFYSANVGDSSMYGVYMKHNNESGITIPKIRKISFDHDIKKKHELKRIQDSSEHSIDEYGYVVKGDNGLAMTRAVGDSNVGEAILPNPTIQQLNKPYTFFILASDGFWDVTDAKTLWTQYRKLVKDGQWKKSAKLVSDWRNAKYPQHDNTSLMFVFVNI